MFDFIRKPMLWHAFEKGWVSKLSGKAPFHLKSIQDCAVFSFLCDAQNLDIAEVGGGDSRLLRVLSKRNKCVNVEKFEGAGNGPNKKIRISRVNNIPAYLGEFDAGLPNAFYDVVFSVSVIEHVASSELPSFFEDGLRILKSGGLWLHAIDMYLDAEPALHVKERFNAYRKWTQDERLAPIGEVISGPPVFTPDMATNPDNVMYQWGEISPELIDLRKKAQSVSVIVAARKR